MPEIMAADLSEVKPVPALEKTRIQIRPSKKNPDLTFFSKYGSGSYQNNRIQIRNPAWTVICISALIDSWQDMQDNHKILVNITKRR